MKLIEPIRLGALTLPNRLVMAPMTRNRAHDTLPGPSMAVYYAQRAAAGLIVSEGAQIAPMGQGYPNTPGLHSDAQLAAWRQVTQAVHAAGGRIFAQLWHVGRISHPDVLGGATPVAPSAIRPAGQVYTTSGLQPFVTPRALTTDEVAEVVGQFRQAAVNARAAGFDGVEIHGANGYLIDQFIQSSTNTRTDRYGGSLENRLRFLREVVEAVSDAWSPDVVGVRLSPGGTFNDMADDDSAATFTAAARLLSGYDLAYLHVVQADLGDGLTALRLTRDAYDGTLIAAGGYDRATGEEAVQAGEADLIGYARLFLSNPDLPERFATGAPLNAWDTDTFYGGGEAGYIDYPALDRTDAWLGAAAA